MKKVFLVLAVASMSLVACKKDYECTIPADPAFGIPAQTVPYPNLDKDAADLAETACTFVGGTWSKQ